MLGSSEILVLFLVVAALVLLPRIRKMLEQRVDEEAIGRRTFEALTQRQTIHQLSTGEAPRIVARFAQVRALRISNYTVHVTDEVGVNALALPGGMVLLTSGLLNLRKSGTISEDELAGVLAHEMGHIELGHSRAREVRETLVSWATRVGPAPTGLLGGLAMNLGLKAMQRRAGREAEKEADAWACALLRDAGYRVSALQTFLARMSSWNVSGGLWSTHPSAEARIEAMKGN